MIVDRLLAYFGVDTDERSFKEAQEEIKALEGQMMGIVTAAAAMGAAVGAAAFSMVTDFADSADATNKLARRIGATAEELQEYDYVAQRSGVSTDLMRNSLEKLQGKVSDAVNGNKDMTETLKSLGIEATAFSKMTIGDQMESIAKGFQGLASDGDRTRLAMKLFEEEGRGMVTVFEGGAEAIAKMRAEARGFGVYSTEDAAMAEEFNDRLLDAKMSLGAIKKLVAIELLPVLTEMMIGFRDFFLENKEWIKSGIVVAFQSLTFAVKGLALALSLLALNRIGAGIMMVTTAVRTMTVAMAAARIGALALAAAQVVMAFAIPAAIGAAIAAVVLIIEDIVSYFRGDKSVTGLIVEEWGKAWDYCDKVITDAVKSMKQSLSNLFSNLIPFDEIRNAWSNIKAISISMWESMVYEMKEMVKGVLPDFAVKAFFDVNKTISDSTLSATSPSAAPAFMAMQGQQQYGLWGAPPPPAMAAPVQVNVTTTLNGTTIDEVNRSVVTNARMANAATYQDVKKGIDY